MYVFFSTFVRFDRYDAFKCICILHRVRIQIRKCIKFCYIFEWWGQQQILSHNSFVCELYWTIYASELALERIISLHLCNVVDFLCTSISVHTPPTHISHITVGLCVTVLYIFSQTQMFTNKCSECGYTERQICIYIYIIHGPLHPYGAAVKIHIRCVSLEIANGRRQTERV